MDGVNKVILLGNIGADPDLRYTNGGHAVLNLRIATNESYLDKDKVRRERTDWHTVVVFGKRGESLQRLLTKGSGVFVEGALRTSSYETKGQKRYKTEVHASNIVLTGRREGPQQSEEPAASAARTAPTSNDVGYEGGDDIPF